MHTYMCVSGGKKYYFVRKFCVHTKWLIASGVDFLFYYMVICEINKKVFAINNVLMFFLPDEIIFEENAETTMFVWFQ